MFMSRTLVKLKSKKKKKEFKIKTPKEGSELLVYDKS